jgi:hypothetical protein
MPVTFFLFFLINDSTKLNCTSWEVATNGTTFIANFVKIGHLVQGGNTHRQHCDLIRLLLLLNKGT